MFEEYLFGSIEIRVLPFYRPPLLKREDKEVNINMMLLGMAGSGLV